MRRRILLASVATLGLMASSSLAADSCPAPCSTPPKYSRAVSLLGGDPYVLAPYPGNTVSATLAKGKKKTILYAEAVLTTGSYPPFYTTLQLALGINVNGLAMQPHDNMNNLTTEVYSPVCTVGFNSCTVVGNWWLDMDDPANAALIGVPITVTLLGGEWTGVSGFSPVDISLRVRLEKK